MDKILLHSCCAPCSVYCVDTLRGEGIEPVSLWFNPNIHPWTEYDQRRSTLLEYGEKERVEVHILEDYGLRDFVRAVAAHIDHGLKRCGKSLSISSESWLKRRKSRNCPHLKISPDMPAKPVIR